MRPCLALAGIGIVPVRALISEPSVQNYGIVYGDPAGEANPEDWEAAVASANATDSILIPGYNISAKYPGQPIYPGQQKDTWKLSISVSADVPSKNASGKDVLFTGTTIQWIPPKSLVSNRSDGEAVGDGSWTTCGLVLVANKLKSKEAKVNQTCDGLLSAPCLDALRDYDERSGPCTDVSFDGAEKCKDDFGSGWIGIPFVDNPNRANWTETNFYYGVDYHEKGDTKAYDAAVQQIWIAITGFTENDSGSSGTANNKTKDPLPGSLRCLRVSDFAEGSRESQSAAPVSMFSVGGVLVAAVCAVFFTFM